MLYVGTSLAAENGRDDPCLIDPSKSIARDGNYAERHMDYWPSYSDISATARRAYLSWLAEGRNAAGADIGYVFLFFYGLERRVLVDADIDQAARGERARSEEHTSELQSLMRISY